MSSPISILRSKFSQCICNVCERSKCKLKLSAFPNKRIILDIDCITKQNKSGVQGKRCDSLIVVENNGVVFLFPVEFKTTLVVPSDVKKQLEGGIKFFKSYHPNQFNCYPVLVSQSLRGPVRRKLQLVSISYNGKKARIRHVLCNQSLSWKAVIGNRRQRS